MYSESEVSSGNAYRGTTGANVNDTSKLMIGAIAGAVAGSLVAALFTEKGIETRRRLGEGSRNMANNFKGKFSDMTEGVADKYEAVKEGVADKYEAVKEGVAEKYEAVKEGAANLIEKGKQKVGMSSGNTAYKDTTDTDPNDSGSKVLLGALAVSVAGAIIWSFASEKGIETRKRFTEGSKNMANNLKEKFSDISEKISDTYEAAKEGASDLIEKGKQRDDMSSGNSAYRGSAGADDWES